MIPAKVLHIGNMTIPLKAKDSPMPNPTRFLDLSLSQHRRLEDIWQKSIDAMKQRSENEMMDD